MDTAYIIPVRIDSVDREFNFIRCVQHLCDNLKTNIIVKESETGIESKVLPLLQKIDQKECDIRFMYRVREPQAFHRTKMLNEMIYFAVEYLYGIRVIVNYDCDVLLKPETHIEARRKIIEEGCDLVYPYAKGEAQVQIRFPNKEDYKTDLISATEFHETWGSLAGHVQYFKTEGYRNGYMENENFVAYAPEDRERMERFIKLGYKVEWLAGHQCFHIEHSRTPNSTAANPHFEQGEALYYKLLNMDREELIEYYENQEYVKKYNQ